MTLLVGMHYKDRVYIAADKALTFVGDDGQRFRHSTALKVECYGEGLVAGTGRQDLYELGFKLAKERKLGDGKNIGHCLEESVAKFATIGNYKPSDLENTGWYFSAPAAHFIPNEGGLVFGLSSHKFGKTPTVYMKEPTFELTGMSLATHEQRVELHRRYKALIFAERFDSNIKKHLTALFAEAASMTDDVTAEYTAMVHCPKHGIYQL